MQPFYLKIKKQSKNNHKKKVVMVSFKITIIALLILLTATSCKKEADDCIGCPCTYTNYYLLEKIKVSCYCRSQLLLNGDTCDASKFSLNIKLTGSKIVESAYDDHHYPYCFEKAFFLNKFKSIQFDCTDIKLKPLNPDILKVNEPLGYSPLKFYVDTNSTSYKDTIISFFTEIILKDDKGMLHSAKSVKVNLKF